MGVSKSTVSRALSGKGRIGADTRARIQAYAKGQERAQISTSNIGVVLPTDAYTTNAPFFQECMLGISEIATMLKYHVLVTTGMINDISDIQMLVEKQKVDGMILLRGVTDDRIIKYLSEKHFPTGLAGSCEYEDIIQVDADNRSASANLMSLLIRQGYRQFAMVVGDMAYQVNQSRCQGYYEALNQYGLDREQQLFYPNFINMEPLDNIICDIMEKKVECVICGDDVICTRFMSRLQAEGYRIPRDISIVSLCNSANLDCFSPAVTAVNVSARQMGNVIARQLISYLRGESCNMKTMLSYEILLRKSVDKIYQM